LLANTIQAAEAEPGRAEAIAHVLVTVSKMSEEDIAAALRHKGAAAN
jgi:hypothetical protein